MSIPHFHTPLSSTQKCHSPKYLSLSPKTPQFITFLSLTPKTPQLNTRNPSVQHTPQFGGVLN